MRPSALLFYVSACATLGAEFHVSPKGNDASPGTVAQPLATIYTAIEKARSTPERDRIRVHAGTYELSAPIKLIAQDSGLTLEAYRTDRPVLSGGRRITGWRPAEGSPGVWRAELPDANWVFRQLFIDGERKQRARSPNQGFFRIEGPSPQDKPARLKFRQNEIAKHWEKLGDVEAVALLAWAPLRMQIRGVDVSNKVAMLSGNPRPSNREENARYYIENAPEALDAPGEWYLNAGKGIVSYVAGKRESLRDAEVVAPRLETMVDASGVRDVTLRGLTFSHTEWPLPKTGLADTQAAIGVRGAVRFENSENCVIEQCTLSHLGGYALELGADCRKFEVIGNRMFDLGAGGVRVGTTEATNVASGNTVANNLIRHGGAVFPSAVGVLILHSGDNRIAHNHIHHLYYTAISVGWTWGYRDSPCKNNIIEFNHLHHIGQGMLSDMGAVYLLGPQPGTVVRNNLIHDVEASNYGGWGLYTDEGSSYITLENNVVYRCKHALFHQHYGRENVIRNNIFAFGKEYQLMRTREESHISFFFTNNIVVGDSEDFLGSNWRNDRFVMDRNVYWNLSDKYKFAGATWGEWRERGHDEHSIREDPQFMDANKGDFRLKRGSPALELGFKPINTRQAGIEKRYR